MKKNVLGLLLMIITLSAVAGNDVWQTLFREKLKEASQGNINAQYDIGSMYQNGRGVSADRDEAKAWYTKAAEQGNQKAANRLELLKSNEARFRKELASADNGNKSSQYKLGKMYTEGVGTDADPEKAVEYFRKSAGQGYEKAEYKLGLIYYEGSGVKASNKTAHEWFSKAADKGNAAAQYYLGKMYASGKGVKKDYATSLKWYSKAVDGGFKQARSEMVDVAEKLKLQEQKKTTVVAKEPEPEATSATVVAAAEKTTPKAEKSSTVKNSSPAEKAAKTGKGKTDEKARPAKKASTARKAPATKKTTTVKKSSKTKKTASAKKVPTTKKTSTAKKTSTRKPAKVARKKKAPASKTVAASKVSGIETLMVAGWSRDGEPVTYLPSAINDCKTEKNKISCYSNDQVRKSPASTIKFKTKSIMRNFTSDGAFEVIYRNLVIEARATTATEKSSSMDKKDVEGLYPPANTLQTGWGKEHILECRIIENSKVSCLKDKKYTFTLVSPQKVATGG